MFGANVGEGCAKVGDKVLEVCAGFKKIMQLIG